MKQSIKAFIPAVIVILVLIITVILLQHQINKDEARCHFLGGVYIDGQCFKAELIKLK